MSLVLDSSTTLAWIYSEETTSAIQQLFDRVLNTGAWVPAIWPLEIGNSLQMAVIHGRIKASFRGATLADLRLLDIKIDDETNAHAWTDTLQLAQECKLTLYDAAYLELAKRKSLPLASLDKHLRTAGKTVNIDLLGI